MTKIISYWDETSKTYKEVSTLDPFPTTAVGGGSGGAEEVEITSPNGPAKTGLANADALAATDVGLLTNDRNFIFNGTSWDRERSAQGAGDAYTGVGLNANALYGFNGTTWDRLRTDGLGRLTVSTTPQLEGTALASAARTATATSSNVVADQYKGVHIILNITAASGTGGLIVRAQGLDPISGNFYSLNGAPPAIVATGIYAYEFYPGITSSVSGPNNVNQRTSTSLPRTWRVQVQVGDATSYTYSVGYCMIL